MRYVTWVVGLWTLTTATSAGAASAAPPPPAPAPENLPLVTAYWEDTPQQAVYVVRGERYKLRVGTQPARVLSLSVDGRDMLGDGGGDWMLTDDAGRRYVPASGSFVPAWDVHLSQSSQPAKSAAARVNVWRASPYYWEVHLLDVPFVPQGAEDAATAGTPIRGHLVFHAHPDRVHVELRVQPTADQRPTRVAWRFDQDDTARETVRDRPVLRLGDGAAVLGSAGGGLLSGEAALSAPLDESQPAAWWVVRPTTSEASAASLFAEELDPLPPSAVAVERGSWLGYDSASGLYRMVAEAHRDAFTFERSWKNPTRRIVSGLNVHPPDTPNQSRDIVVLCATGLGNLAAGMLTDAHGFPVGIPAFVCKNFAGEKEEPDDAAYGDIVFPLHLTQGQPTDLQVMALFQQWGNHMLKQVSSIRFFNIYWHLSHGVSETTCFTHAWMKLRGVMVGVPDFRPYSGPFVMGQPQHGCLTWPSFLGYQDADGDVVPMYERTTFRSIAPNLAHFTMHFRTSDDAATIKAQVIEVPQTDEARTFVRLRYDWHKPVTVAGDARETFRWLSVYEKYLPSKLVWNSAEGEGVARAIETGDGPMLLAEPLPDTGAFAGVDGGVKGIGATEGAGGIQGTGFHSMVLVRSLRGRLGGEPVTTPHLSADFGAKNGSYWLGHDQPELRIQPGDYLEADIMLMPHAEVTLPLFKPKRELEYWVNRPPRVMSVLRGEKVADFPATVKAADDVARFSVEGGLDTIPLVVTGMSRAVLPMLWHGTVWQDQQVHGGDGYQVDPDGDGAFRFTFVYPIRGTEQHDLTVSLMKCSSVITRISDINGLPTVTAQAEGDFTTESPACFMPGQNTVTAGSGLVAFHGRAKEVRAVPVTYLPASGEAALSVDRWSPDGTHLRIEGAGGKLGLDGLIAGGYTVTVFGDESSVAVTTQGLELDIPPGAGAIVVQREPSE